MIEPFSPASIRSTAGTVASVGWELSRVHIKDPADPTLGSTSRRDSAARRNARIYLQSLGPMLLPARVAKANTAAVAAAFS